MNGEYVVVDLRVVGDWRRLVLPGDKIAARANPGQGRIFQMDIEFILNFP